MNKKHFFSLNSLKPQKSGNGGNRTSVTKNEVSSLDKISLESLRLKKGSSLEPIWHPNANKIGYCLQGKALVTVLTPSFHDVAELRPGEGAFAPASYFHYIENLTKDNAEIAAFFSHPDPDYIGVGQAVSECSKEVLASTFNRPVEFFNKFIPPTGPVVIAGG